MQLSEESVTLPPDASALHGSGTGYPLYITAKKYFVKKLEVFEEDTDTVTILALHSTSFHKETWEPMIQALFDTALRNGSGKVKIREIWAMDCPNHGHAGVLNKEVLKRAEFANNCEWTGVFREGYDFNQALQLAVSATP